jgi:hypothetical protein
MYHESGLNSSIKYDAGIKAATSRDWSTIIQKYQGRVDGRASVNVHEPALQLHASPAACPYMTGAAG